MTYSQVRIPALVAAEDSPVVLVGETEGNAGANGASPLIIAEDIEKRVTDAGGNTDGVIVASLSWISADDLDLHLVTPGGAEICFQNRKAAGGELDVDMCVQGRRGGVCKDRPVENIVFADEAPHGRYRIYVQNFNYHPDVQSKAVQVDQILDASTPKKREALEKDRAKRLGRDRPVHFQVLVKVAGTRRLFSGICTANGKTHAESNVKIFEFEYLPGPSVNSIFEVSADPSSCGYRQGLPGPDSQPRLEAVRGTQTIHTAARSVNMAADQRAATAKKRKKKRAQAKSDAEFEALSTVRASSRDTLLTKPSKVLRELLQDMGATCRGCLDKADFVDRLREVAGANDADEL